MLLATLICSAGTFAFGGGAGYDMVLATGQTLRTDVCVLLDPTRSYGKARVDYKNLAELRNALKGKFDLSNGKKQEPQKELWGVGPYPGNFFYKQRLSLYADRLPALAFKSPVGGDPFTVSPGQVRYLTLDQVSGFFQRKHLRASWFFEQARLSIFTTLVREPELAKLIARALGGKLMEDDKAYTINVDPAALRDRAIALFREEGAQARTRADLVDATYHESLYQELTDQQIAQLYGSPSSELQLQFNLDSPLGRAALARLWIRIGGPDADERSLNAQQLELRRLVASHVDYSLGIWAVIKPDGVPSCMIRGHEGDKNWALVF